MSRLKKIDDICVDAINHLQGVIATEYKKQYNCERNISFIEASKILGVKYFQRHFGKMPIEEVIFVLNQKRGVRGRIRT